MKDSIKVAIIFFLISILQVTGSYSQIDLKTYCSTRGYLLSSNSSTNQSVEHNIINAYDDTLFVVRKSVYACERFKNKMYECSIEHYKKTYNLKLKSKKRIGDWVYVVFDGIDFYANDKGWLIFILKNKLNRTDSDILIKGLLVNYW